MDENADAAHRRHRLGIVILAGLGALALMAAVALVVALTDVARPPDDPAYRTPIGGMVTTSRPITAGADR
ncbi:hypothetical protein WCD74_14550 [Actinomycetospora sp. OC33-EN08]|uniref:Uncharacterized protein n=1 Tax=Actinomycetospora aurantiaca TaxID=3129233 RepID=A0ABU8MNY7_9PSEU